MSQYKAPTSLHTLRQSPFRASINPSKSYGGVVAGKKRGGGGSKKQSK